MRKEDAIEITLSAYKEKFAPIIDSIDAQIIDAAKAGETHIMAEISHNDVSFDNIKYLRLIYNNLGFDTDTISHVFKENYTSIMIDWGH